MAVGEFALYPADFVGYSAGIGVSEAIPPVHIPPPVLINWRQPVVILGLAGFAYPDAIWAWTPAFPIDVKETIILPASARTSVTVHGTTVHEE